MSNDEPRVTVTCSYCGEPCDALFKHGTVKPSWCRGREGVAQAFIPILIVEHECQSQRARDERARHEKLHASRADDDVFKCRCFRRPKETTQ